MARRFLAFTNSNVGKTMLSTSLHCSSSHVVMCRPPTSSSLPAFSLQKRTLRVSLSLYLCLVVPAPATVPRIRKLLSSTTFHKQFVHSSIPTSAFDIGFPLPSGPSEGPLVAAQIYVSQCRLPLSSSAIPVTLRLRLKLAMRHTECTLPLNKHFPSVARLLR